MTSFTDDMRQPRADARRAETLELRIVPAGARLGRLLHVSPSEPVVVATRLRLADRETHGDRDAARPRSRSFPDLTARDLEERFVLRAPPATGTGS